MKTLKVGITGTRYGMSEKQRGVISDTFDLMAKNYYIELHHGDCVGVDAEADHLIREYQKKYKIIIHPPVEDSHRARCKTSPFATLESYEKHASEFAGKWGQAVVAVEPKTYLARNRDIVNATHIVIAAPQTAIELQHSGTWYTIRYANKQRVPLLLVNPDGSTSLQHITHTLSALLGVRTKHPLFD